MIEIPVKNKTSAHQNAVIDDDDHALVSALKWSITIKKYRGAIWSYPRARMNGKDVLMHRLILRAKKGQMVDHINGDRFDNRKANLRFCTSSENMRNRKKPRTKNKFKGVQPANGKFRSRIYLNGQAYNLGRFTKEIDAARAYDVAAVRLHGSFALLNFPHEKNLAEKADTSHYKFLEPSCAGPK